MAISTKQVPNYKRYDWSDRVPLETKTTPIGGKLLKVSLSLSHIDGMNNDPDYIKNILADQLAKGMLQNNMIQFTKIANITGTTDYLARCWLADNGDVKILNTVSLNL
jgi:hypothetical protein